MKAGGRDSEKGGGGYGAPGGRYQNSSEIHQQEAGGGSGVGGPTANIRGLCKGYRIRGREEFSQTVVETDGCRKTAEDHAKIKFDSSVGATATVI